MKRILLVLFLIFSMVTLLSAGSRSFPDVCRTPSAGSNVPVPYPNSSRSKKKPARVKSKSRSSRYSSRPHSRGDESGTSKGMVSRKLNR